MAKINGTYVSLHENDSNYPYYKGSLEFRDTLCLAEHFVKTGSTCASDTYTFTDIPKNGGAAEITRESLIEAALSGKFTDKTLFFTESNSAHHLTYFYVKEAAKHLNPEELLVVNFDQHLDAGAENNPLYCGSWGGRYICSAVGCDYLVVGPKNSKDVLKRFDPKFVGPTYDAALYSNCNKDKILWFTNEELTNICTNYNKIYVTVDMDILTNSASPKRTNWGPGYLNDCGPLINFLNLLPAEKIIAADITGFPPVDTNQDRETLAMLESYIADIRKTAEALCSLMGIAPYLD